MPGILNDSGWNLWNYQLEGLRTFEGDGARWLWKEFDRHALGVPLGFVIAGASLVAITLTGLIYGVSHRVEGFAAASILGFSSVSYCLMATGYFLLARRLHGATWCAPLWFLPHFVTALLAALQPLERPLRNAGVTLVIEIVKDGKSRSDSDRS
jgi:hypothetical protein